MLEIELPRLKISQVKSPKWLVGQDVDPQQVEAHFANGLLERRRYQTNPERYEYVLTAKGRDTILVMQALLQVGDKWAVSGNAGPPLKFVDRKTGHLVKLAMVDNETGQRVKAQDLQPQAGPGADEEADPAARALLDEAPALMK